ncbi:MAG: hypothetical protein Q8N30_06235 [Methylococcales bacterium]|nr:hypothetical protein [Methylococcales bacterium]
MFNFKELKLDRRESTDNLSSFVGIRRNNNELEFRLPKGFEEFPDNDFDATKQLFFRMYRTFKKFEQNNSSLSLDEKSAGKDNIETKGNAYLFKDKEDNEVLLYSKISVIENLLDAYKDLALDVIERRVGRDEKIDYSKIDQYLHKAIYLPNDVIYLDEMDLPRHTLHYDSATLVDLFCFILYELETELEQDSDSRVKDLANRFKEQHLSHEQSLFNEETFETTITVLKDILDEIDKITAYKDEDYWQLYEAIESFLYGELDMQNTHEDGIFWGISNFYQIWEDMCNTYAFANFDVVYADTNIIFDGKCVANDKSTGYSIFKKTDFNNPFFVEFRDKKRWMRPDCIHFYSESKDIFSESIIIVTKNKHQNGRLDFDVYLKDKSKKDVYDGFCYNLKQAIINSSRISHNRVSGARVVGDNSFKNYPKNELEQEKYSIENKHNMIINKLSRHIILDWKYMDASCFLSLNKKIEQDINKQLCYEFSLQNCYFDFLIRNQFVIPYFYKDKREDIGDNINNEILYHRIRDNKIEVFQANFTKIQEVYLSHD